MKLPPSIIVLLALYAGGFLLGLAAPGWVVGWLALRNDALFGAGHVWTLFTAAFLVADFFGLLAVGIWTVWLTRLLEQSLRSKYLWGLLLAGSALGGLAAFLLAPKAAEPIFLGLNPVGVACGALWWLYRSARWSLFGAWELSAQWVLTIVAAFILVPLLLQFAFAPVVAFVVSALAGFAGIIGIERRDGFGGGTHPSPKVKSHYIELD